MAFPIQIPRLGWSMEQGTFVGWLKQEGDLIQPGMPLFELEGEKALQEIEAVDAGRLRIPPDAPRPGTVIPVGTTVGYLVAENEAAPWESGGTPVVPVTVAEADSTVPSAPPTPLPTTVAPPSVRRLARELGVPLDQFHQTASSGRVTRQAVVRAAATASAPSASSSSTRHASPRARRVARELGIDWARLTPSGTAGRICEADVRQAAASQTAPAAAPPTASGETVAISSRRQVIAQRMLASQQQTAPVTLTTQLDATQLVSLRQQFKTTAAVVPAYTDLIAKLAATCLQLHPLMTAQWTDSGLVLPSGAARDGSALNGCVLNLGIAVDTDAGLLVPVLKDVTRRSIPDIATESRRLIEQARSGRLAAVDMQGGHFTITNLGAYGIDAFTPIINLPETAILGVGAIRRVPVVLDDDRIVPRDQLTLSLTFDHRVVDGAGAARFLQTLVQALESPAAWLLNTA